jgi:hypothetical protein
VASRLQQVGLSQPPGSGKKDKGLTATRGRGLQTADGLLIPARVVTCKAGTVSQGKTEWQLWVVHCGGLIAVTP